MLRSGTCFIDGSLAVLLRALPFLEIPFRSRNPLRLNFAVEKRHDTRVAACDEEARARRCR